MKKIDHLQRIVIAFFIFGMSFIFMGWLDIGYMIDSYNYRKYKDEYKSLFFIVEQYNSKKETSKGSTSKMIFEMSLEKSYPVFWHWDDGITYEEGFPDLIRTQVPIGGLWARKKRINDYDIVYKTMEGELFFRPEYYGTYGAWWVHCVWGLPLLFLIFRIYQAIKSMKKNKSITVLLIYVASIITNAQTSPFQGDRVILGNQSSMQNLVFTQYKPVFKATMLYKNQNEAKNETPETLVSSIISASTQAWVDYNTFGGAEKSRKITKEALERAKTANKEKVFLNLTSKMTFNANGSEMCIVKFYIHSDGLPKPISGTYLFQKVANRWYHSASPWASNLMIMMMSFDDDKLATILKGKTIGDKIIDNLIVKIVDKKGINLDKLYIEYDSWYAKNDKIKKDYFLDKNSWGYK
jgi:hypothetical protein